MEIYRRGFITDMVLEKVFDLLAPEVIEEIKTRYQEKNKLVRCRRILGKVIKTVGKMYDKEIEYDEKVEEAFTMEMLNPSQTAKELLNNLQWYFMKYVNFDNTDEEKTIVRNICETYLKEVKDIIDNADIMNEIHSIKELMCFMIDNVEKKSYLQLKQQECTQSTRIIREKFHKTLFWDDKITLEDVYLEPKILGQIKSISDAVDEFINQERNSLLVIEGAPGIGKSSLVSKFSNKYLESKFYFLKLSELDFEDNIGIQGAISQLMIIDDEWKKYLNYGNVLFLDGYDEISGKISETKFFEWIRKLQSRGIKIIVTTRPNYIIEAKKEDIIKLVPYDSTQIQKWILNYMNQSGLEEEKILLTIEKVNKRINDTKFMNIMGIPIFLYIIINSQMDISNIESETKLFDQVFEELRKDKVFQEHYDMAHDVAMNLGYFNQAHMQVKYLAKWEASFLMLLHKNMSVDINSEELGKIFGNSFVHIISEGSNDLEFYHKSIQDYFSAKYIFLELQEIIESDGDKKEQRYFSLLDKYLIQEELSHLNFFILQLSGEKKQKWEIELKKIFINIVNNGIYPCQDNWFCDRFAEQNGLATIISISARIRYFMDNHLSIMGDILNTSIVFQIDLERYINNIAAFLELALEDLASISAEQRTTFFWNCFKYLELKSQVLFVCLYGKPLATFLTQNVYIQNNILGKWEINSCITRKLTFNLLNSKSYSLHLYNAYIYEGKIDNYEAREMYIKPIKINATEISNSKFINSKFFIREIDNAKFVSIDFNNCILSGNKTGKNSPIRNTSFFTCHFSETTLMELDVDKSVSFENSTFENCIFKELIDKNVMFFRCKFDIFSFSTLPKRIKEEFALHDNEIS